MRTAQIRCIDESKGVCKGGTDDPVIDQISDFRSADLSALLTDLGLIGPDDIEIVQKLQVDPSGLWVKVYGEADLTSLLALGVAKGSEGKLIVPYAVSAS